MKRKNKKNGIIAAVVMLSGVSLVSVGFASWIISGGETIEVGGTIEADDVSDQRYLIGKVDGYNDGTKVEFHNNIVFGHPSGSASSSAWLKYDGDLVENLTATTYFWVANLPADGDMTVSGNTITLTSDSTPLVRIYSLSASDATKWSDAVATGLIANLPTPVLSLATGEGNTKSEGGLSWRKIQATVTFAWGTNGNPYTYYNGLTYTKALGDEAKTKLTTLYGVNNLTYSTTIKTGNLITA